MPFWFENPWFIGIVGGILSGFFVTIFSRIILSRRDRKEYIQKIRAANHEIIYSIRSGIPEDIIPKNNIIRSLIFATARKYGIDEKDLYQPKEIVQELTKEIMDSAFIPAKIKGDYLSNLDALLEGIPERHLAFEGWKMAGIYNYREKMINSASVILGILVTFLSVAITLTMTPKQELFKTDIDYYIFPAFLAIMSIIAVFVFNATSRRFERMRKKRNYKMEMEDKLTEITPKVEN